MRKEKSEKHIAKKSLRRTFMCLMLTAVFIIASLSIATIWGCDRLQKMILPDADEVLLHVLTVDGQDTERIMTLRLAFGEETEVPTLQEQIDTYLIKMGEEVTTYSVEKIERRYDSLSPKRKAAYSALSACKVLLPACYSILSTLLCAIWFYRHKLQPPISILQTATEHIADKNLDFVVAYDSQDEMGGLCRSFETMRQILYKNNQQLWHMLEERRMLQASLAHDLRNPIAIILGYTEHLQEKLRSGRLTGETLTQTLPNLSSAAKRLSRYTESIQDIQRFDDIEISRNACMLPSLLSDMAEDFSYSAKQRGLTVEVDLAIHHCSVMLDSQILYRILENIFVNAMRFAKKTIRFSASLSEQMLQISIVDDGPGFPSEILKVKNGYNLSIRQEDSHMGIGLIISRILCEKHGGALVLGNDHGGGARADICILVKENTEKLTDF